MEIRVPMDLQSQLRTTNPHLEQNLAPKLDLGWIMRTAAVRIAISILCIAFTCAGASTIIDALAGAVRGTHASAVVLDLRTGTLPLPHAAAAPSLPR